MKRKLKINDVVAILMDKPELKLRAGQVGTIVETLNGGDVLVEFSNIRGEAYAITPLEIEDVRSLDNNA